MKRIAAIVFLIVLISPAFTQTIQEYSGEKVKYLMGQSLKEEGYFRFAIVPVPMELAIIQQYPKWIEKRFNKERMIKEAKSLMTQAEGKLYAILFVKYTGDWMSKGKTEIRIPDDFSDYLFVENESGKYLPCTKADIPLMGSSVNSFNDSTQITLEFIVTDELFAGARKLIFTVGGLYLTETKFSFDLPMSDMFQDCPAEVRSVLVVAGIWKQ